MTAAPADVVQLRLDLEPREIRYTSLLTGSSAPTFVSYDPSRLDEGSRTFWESVACITALRVAGAASPPEVETRHA